MLSGICYKAFAIVVIAVFSAGGCSGQKSSKYRIIPDVEIECAPAQAGKCHVDSEGSLVYLGLIKDSSFDCTEELKVVDDTNIAESFDALGKAKLDFEIFLRGFVTSWVGPLENTVGRLEKGTYQACGFVDTNDNGELDLDEPVGEGTVTPGDPEALINDWYPF